MDTFKEPVSAASGAHGAALQEDQLLKAAKQN